MKNSDINYCAKITFVFNCILLLLANVVVIHNYTFSQTTTIGYTGAPQNVTIPSCVSTLTVTLNGAGGGGPNGGGGAQLNLNIPVQPGDVVTYIIGQAATGVNGGYPNGGNGATANTPGYESYGGGGSSMIYINGVLVAVAGAGGGQGGGTTDAFAANGGCATGDGTAGAPFGQGGQNGTQTAGGAGGPPWIASGNAGQAGAYLQGGDGGSDPCFNLGPGGGGGGGYYGGGGGGSDCFGSGSLGGGAGGGGSSLFPPGSGCVSDVNTGNGSAIMNTGGVLASNTGPYCAGQTIHLHASSGLTYSWSGPNGFTSTIQNPVITNSTAANAGVYGVLVTGTGCADTAYTTVVVNPPITPNAGLDDTVCFGTPFQLSGSITLPNDAKIWSYLATGITPTPTVSFAPNFNSLSPTITVNQSGLYRFILKETNTLCGVFRDTVKIYVKKMDITSVLTNPLCEGASTGTILLGGQQAQEFSFDNGVTWSTNPLGTGFAAGSYTVCVRDNNLCKACSTVTLVDPLPIVLSTSNDTLICQNGTGHLIASATGGNSYQFHWTGIVSMNDSVDVQPIGDSTYYVQAESENGCLSAFDSIIVTVRPSISGIISPQDTICPGYPATLSITGNGGIGMPYDFLWSNGQTGSGASNTIFVTPTTNTTFSVTITDACESSPLTLSTSIVLAPLPIPEIAITDGVDKKCEIASFDILNMTDTTMVQSVIWNVSNGYTSSSIDTLHVSDLSAGLYNIQLIVASPQGCIDSTTFTNYLTVHPQPISLFKYSPNPVYMFSTNVNFLNYSSGANSYIWNFESGVPAFSQLENPSTILPDGQTGEYLVSLEVTSEFGCKDTSIQKIVVMPELLFYAPNSFTPDGDEHNQHWGLHIEGIDITNFNLIIFNRWGEIIWESNDPSATWDGTYNGKIIPPGTYSWVARAKDLLNDGKYDFNGYINILR